jgi:hypothetical protein
LPQGFGLGLAFVVQMNTRRPPSQFTGFHKVIDGVPNQQNVSHAVSMFQESTYER